MQVWSHGSLKTEKISSCLVLLEAGKFKILLKNWKRNYSYFGSSWYEFRELCGRPSYASLKKHQLTWRHSKGGKFEKSTQVLRNESALWKWNVPQVGNAFLENTLEIQQSTHTKFYCCWKNVSLEPYWILESAENSLARTAKLSTVSYYVFAFYCVEQKCSTASVATWGIS